MRRLAELGVLEDPTTEDYGFKMGKTEVRLIWERFSVLNQTDSSDET
ncbi:MAG: hypothetical protein RI560_09670 [Natronomonas sp.]|nr:hypothetical protein [Natronomonas sp.]